MEKQNLTKNLIRAEGFNTPTPPLCDDLEVFQYSQMDEDFTFKLNPECNSSGERKYPATLWLGIFIAKKMKTSRVAIDNILDPTYNTSIDSLERFAHILGKRLTISVSPYLGLCKSLLHKDLRNNRSHQMNITGH